MAFLGIGKKRGILDLSEKYKRERDNKAIAGSLAAKQNSSNAGSAGNVNNSNPFSFFESYGSSSSSTSGNAAQDSFHEMIGSDPASADEKRKKLAKRIMDMTSKLEDLSNQVYHLQQRLEVLERKSGTRTFD